MVIKIKCKIKLLHLKCRAGICRYSVRYCGAILYELKALRCLVRVLSRAYVCSSGGIYVVSAERKMSNYESIIFAVMKFIPGKQFSPLLSCSVAKFIFSHEVEC